jgi:translation initiation factor IF-3
MAAVATLEAKTPSGSHRFDADAARATKAQARADRQAEEDAEREAAHAAGPVAQKKERRRSENLDPEIEA